MCSFIHGGGYNTRMHSSFTLHYTKERSWPISLLLITSDYRWIGKVENNKPTWTDLSWAVTCLVAASCSSYLVWAASSAAVNYKQQFDILILCDFSIIHYKALSNYRSNLFFRGAGLFLLFCWVKIQACKLQWTPLSLNQTRINHNVSLQNRRYRTWRLKIHK